MENTQKHYTGGEIKKARQSSSMGLIIRQKEPPNLETPFDQFDSFLTPTELFYIRSHFPAPKLDLASYQLRIDTAAEIAVATRRDDGDAVGRSRPGKTICNHPVPKIS
jgi:hypothetical protein